MGLGKFVPLTFLAAVVFCASPAPGADAKGDPKEMYASLFAEEEKAALATPGRADDLAFAKKLLAAADGVSDSPLLQMVMYEKALDFAARCKDGRAVAKDAARRLAAADPKRKAECDDRVLKMLEAQLRAADRTESATVARELLDHLLATVDGDVADHRAADAVAHLRRAGLVATQFKLPEAEGLAERLKAAAAAEKIDAEIAACQKTLAATPGNEVTARRLLMLYLVEKDDPNQAEKLLASAGPDEQFKTFLPLLKKDASEIPEALCTDLGGWYCSLAAKASPAGRPKMLTRARGFYQRFLDLHNQSDGPALRVKIQLAKVDKDLERCGTPTPVGGKATGGAGTGKNGIVVVVTEAMRAWAKQRDALAPVEQVAALQKKLSEINKTSEELVATFADRDGKIRDLFMKDSRRLVSLTPLVGMELTKLKIARTAVTNLTPLKGMRLEDLDATSCESLASLEGLEGMPLRELRLNGSMVTSLAPLKGIAVQSLDIRDCKGLTSLKGLDASKLKHLQADGSGLQSLAGLKGAPLDIIKVQHCEALTSLAGVEGLPMVEFVVKACPITSIEPIRTLKPDTLEVSECHGVRDLTPIQGLPVKNLVLSDMPLANLDLLRGMPLKKLDISKCSRVRNFEVLLAMPLEELILTEMPLTNLDALRGLKLHRLVVRACPNLTSLAALEGMPLKSLTLQGCKALTSLKGIDALPLTHIDIRDTRFATASFVADLKKKIPTLKDIEQQ
jgi:hypothetical protein